VGWCGDEDGLFGFRWCLYDATGLWVFPAGGVAGELIGCFPLVVDVFDVWYWCPPVGGDVVSPPP
jgi:hypothetical protein